MDGRRGGKGNRPTSEATPLFYNRQLAFSLLLFLPLRLSFLLLPEGIGKRLEDATLRRPFGEAAFYASTHVSRLPLVRLCRFMCCLTQHDVK